MSKFTREHYQFIASVIRNAKMIRKHRVELAERTAEELRSTNERFDRSKFLTACDPEQEFKNRAPMGNKKRMMVLE